jgi:medium-chain acyl-[acyl-carrier-protein] hydrolase
MHPFEQPVTMRTYTGSYSQWLCHARPKIDARIRLFCFPFAGGGASMFLPWIDKLAPKIAVYPVQLPGRENQFTVPAFRRLPALLERLGEVLAAFTDMPYAFFGHSMGGLICFELARHLRREHYPLPRHLFISGLRAPQVGWKIENPPVHQLPEEKFIERIRKLNGTPESILSNRELLRLVLPTLRADFELCETYRYISEEPLDCSISAFGGVEDKNICLADIAAWKAQTTRKCRVRMFPGDHFFIYRFQEMVLRAIDYDLSEDG